jgi:hypothetical protein
MTESNDVQSSLDRMKIHMELRGLRPNTVSTFARCARCFLAQAPHRLDRFVGLGFICGLRTS